MNPSGLPRFLPELSLNGVYTCSGLGRLRTPHKAEADRTPVQASPMLCGCCLSGISLQVLTNVIPPIRRHRFRGVPACSVPHLTLRLGRRGKGNLRCAQLESRKDISARRGTCCFFVREKSTPNMNLCISSRTHNLLCSYASFRIVWRLNEPVFRPYIRLLALTSSYRSETRHSVF